jgi:hypothetical protein
MKMLNESELGAVAGGHGHGHHHGRGERGEEGGGLGGLGLSITGPVTQLNEAVVVQIMLGSGTQTAVLGQGNASA